MDSDLQPLSETEEEALRNVVEGMTPGPWCITVLPHKFPEQARLLNASGEQFTGDLWRDDAEAIVTVRNNAPRMLATITALRNRVIACEVAISEVIQEKPFEHSMLTPAESYRSLGDLFRDTQEAHMIISNGAAYRSRARRLSDSCRLPSRVLWLVERIALIEKTRDELQEANTREVIARLDAEEHTQELTDELGDWQNRLSATRTAMQKELGRTAIANKMLSESNEELTRKLTTASDWLGEMARVKCENHHRSECCSNPDRLLPCVHAVAGKYIALISNADVFAATEAPAPSAPTTPRVIDSREAGSEPDVVNRT